MNSGICGFSLGCFLDIVCKNTSVLKPAFVSAHVDSYYLNITSQSPPRKANKHGSEAIKLNLFGDFFIFFLSNQMKSVRFCLDPMEKTQLCKHICSK